MHLGRWLDVGRRRRRGGRTGFAGNNRGDGAGLQPRGAVRPLASPTGSHRAMMAR
jgi:hypothetical protein